MKTAAEYREFAAWCRDQSALFKQSDDRRVILEMADIWDRIADQQETDVKQRSSQK
jgi:ferredoxin-fold anticodon binding domain-containing protein